MWVTKSDAEWKVLRNEKGEAVKKKVQMHDGVLPDGSPQPLYFPADHPRAGIFKGMQLILEECGIPAGVLKIKAMCSGAKRFPCHDNVIVPGMSPCCCWKALYDQPSFINQKSRLEEIARDRVIMSCSILNSIVSSTLLSRSGVT